MEAEPENQPLPAEGLASTARISLVSRPPSLLSEHRALPALPRRTTPLPALKTLFPAPTPAPSDQPTTEAAAPASTETPSSKEETGVAGDDVNREAEADAPFGEGETDLDAVWHKMALLNEELAHTIQERDKAVEESHLLRQQLEEADKALEGREGAGAPNDELARVIKERDEARAELQALKGRAPVTPPANHPADFSKTKELVFLAGERDQARKQYSELRKQFETLKQEQNPREESGKFRKELEQQLEGFRQKLEERNKEIAALKANAAVSGGAGEGDEKLKEEIASLREELKRAKDEVSIAQRGLALSQKALHETRDTLREATEGTSLSRHNFDNLKNECATLTQQNTVLQAQNDQLARELAAAKSKMTSRL
jgi:DNA repair exonuclease SbcCD ATPase subunit